MLHVLLQNLYCTENDPVQRTKNNFVLNTDQCCVRWENVGFNICEAKQNKLYCHINAFINNFNIMHDLLCHALWILVRMHACSEYL